MKRNFGQVLIEKGHLDASQLAKVAGPVHGDLELAQAIVEAGLVDAKSVLEARAEALGVSCIEINPYSIDPAIVEVVPEAIARRIRAVPLFRVGNDLTLAMVDPSDVIAIDEVRDATGCDVLPVLAPQADIETAIQHYYGVDNLIRDLVEAAQLASAVPDSRPEEKEVDLAEDAGDDTPLVRIVNLIILKAIRRGASDIHIEPDEDGVRVRYRVDGRLEADEMFPPSLQAGIVSRIKIMADLDLAQKRLPQDGRISLRAEGRRIDFRISTLPTVRGEKTVMRLLDTGSTVATLEELGLQPAALAQWRRLIEQPNGIILVTGPTGSGKTTTLYSSLAAINTLDRNIVTVEDPVEYDFPVINQVQVNTKAGLTFATALRSILRQDPNVVMVGEIRDADTATIGIRAALTGHLVLSTLHTNDASSAATRLIDIGVEPYLVASALKGILAQRLVRRICTDCRTAHESVPSVGMPDHVVEWLERNEFQSFVGKGCRHCGDTGFRGRVAIHELLVVDEDIERAIVRGAPVNELRRLARQAGMVDLFGDGLHKAAAGLTTVEEILVATRMEEAEATEDTATAPPAPEPALAPVE